ncbi:MAG TPA: nuclear transport factor 2 family protein [Candidatus Saccharimonadales bacterium]|jgi:hypothetical protein|nr:nuclear transport factor 2 family protein [Candidatus Saccharimonadales bacterium]
MPMLKSRSEANSMRAVLLMLRDFLEAVGRGGEGGRPVFENFFADDVVYTSSNGVTINKEELLKVLDGGSADRFHGSCTAEDITVRPYDDIVVVNFCMVMHNEGQGRQEVSYFRNTGTFLKRSGRWQAVAWQATRSLEGARVELKTS